MKQLQINDFDFPSDFDLFMGDPSIKFAFFELTVPTIEEMAESTTVDLGVRFTLVNDKNRHTHEDMDVSTSNIESFDDLDTPGFVDKCVELVSDMLEFDVPQPKQKLAVEMLDFSVLKIR